MTTPLLVPVVVLSLLPLSITLAPRPGQAQQHVESWVPGINLANLNPPAPCSTGYGSDQGLLLPSPSCPTEQPGCSKGARRAWLGSQDKGWGPGHPGKVAPPCLAPSSPTLHLVSPLDQTRNKENVWNLSCCLLFLLPAGRGPSPHPLPLGKTWPGLACLQKRIGYCLGPGGGQCWVASSLHPQHT